MDGRPLQRYRLAKMKVEKLEKGIDGLTVEDIA